jgi:hypothetical protein
LATTRWSWGHKTRNCFIGCLTKNKESFYDYSLRVWYKPRVSLWGNLLLLQHSALRVPTS